MQQATSETLVEEAAREMRICNACRYCEGYCAVWDAIERRPNFSKSDIFYLSNLCHDCRECYYVCPFNEPHEYGLNIPKVLSNVRQQTYKEFVFPRGLSWVYDHVPLITASLSILALVGLFSFFIFTHGLSGLFSVYIPMDGVMPLNMFKAISFSVYAYVIIMWSLEGYNYWKSVSQGKKFGTGNVLKATWDVLSHRNFRGGGAGCNYPDEKASSLRLVLHPMAFFGFLIDWITILFYPFTNVIPLALYTLGSVLIFAGSAGLLYLKSRSDPAPENGDMASLDYPFTTLLLLTGITGIIFPFILGIPEWVIPFLAHDAFIFIIFLMAPFSKFIHPIFRYLSLILNRAEESEEVSA